MNALCFNNSCLNNVKTTLLTQITNKHIPDAALHGVLPQPPSTELTGSSLHLMIHVHIPRDWSCRTFRYLHTASVLQHENPLVRLLSLSHRKSSHSRAGLAQTSRSSAATSASWRDLNKKNNSSCQQGHCGGKWKRRCREEHCSR